MELLDNASQNLGKLFTGAQMGDDEKRMMEIKRQQMMKENLGSQSSNSELISLRLKQLIEELEGGQSSSNVNNEEMLAQLMKKIVGAQASDQELKNFRRMSDVGMGSGISSGARF